MAQGELRVTFEPSGRAVQVPPGATVRDAATLAGIPIDFPCGGQGSCGKCRVRMSPAGQETDSEQRLLPPDDRAQGYRLACQTLVSGACHVEVPEHSLLGRSYQILEHAGPAREREGEGAIRVIAFELPEPTLDDDASDLARLERVVGPLDASVATLRRLGAQLRAQDFRGHAVVAGTRLLDVLGTEHGGRVAVAAFDIGTTTLVGTLHDAAAGLQLARASAINPQTSFGDDVVSRITRAAQDASALAQLQSAVVGAVNALLRQMCDDAAIKPSQVYEVTLAGNTTMQHLLLGIDPASLGQIPFVAAVSGPVHVPAHELGIAIHPEGMAYVFPVIGGFVGGDTVAGMVATEIHDLPGSTLLVDIGTNGEIVAQYNGHLIATSCAAGPAFEGARIQHGMRAAPGAIEEIALRDDVEWRTIGHGAPVGLCGSALIDIIAELLRVGLLRFDGVLATPDTVPEGIPELLRARVRDGEAGGEFVVAWEHETQQGRALVLTQRDVRELQLGTGAIRSGIQTMLHRVELPIEQLDRLLVAGAFGNYIRCENAQRMGLLPGAMPAERIHFVGNTSLSGAQGAALSQSVRARAGELAHGAEHIDLSRDPYFYELFVEAMFFPDA